MFKAVRCSVSAEPDEALLGLGNRRESFPQFGTHEGWLSIKGWKNSHLPFNFLIQDQGTVCLATRLNSEDKDLCAHYKEAIEIEGLLNLEIVKHLSTTIYAGQEVTRDNFELTYLEFDDHSSQFRDRYITCEFVTR